MKGRSKISAFADDMILLVENMNSTRKLLELINGFSKAAGYKINIQKSVLCTNSDLSKKEIKETIQLKIASKTIKYLGIDLTKEVKDLYTENYKTLMKETEEDTN